MTKVFFDTSVLLASLRSPAGGSSELLQYAVVEAIASFISDDVIGEVANHIHEVGPELRSPFLKYLANIPFTTISITAGEVKWAMAFTPEKDSPIVAAADKGNVDYLVTLDKRHLLNNKEEIEQHVRFKIVRPGELLEIVRDRIP